MYYNDTQLVKSIGKIVIYYFKYSFIIDFFAIFPFFLMHKYLLVLKILRLLKMRTYLFRINNFVETLGTKLFRFRNEIIINIQKITKFCLVLLLSLHTMSCIWANFGIHYENGWVVTNADKLPENPSEIEVYIASVYWVMSAFTTVGYGDITAGTNREYFFN